MSGSIKPDTNLIRTAIKCRCPRCKNGEMFASLWSLSLVDKCPECGMDLAKNDSGDGPAVFLIFILGFLLVPIAWIFELYIAPPLWVHAVLWGAVALALTLGSLKPIKSYVIALQFKHRPGDWDS